LRILWLSHLVPYPPKGGVLQRSYYLLQEISRNHDIDLLAFHQKALMKPLFSDINEGLTEAKIKLGKFCRNFEYVSIPSDATNYGLYWMAIKSLISEDPYNINWLKSSEFSKLLEKYLKLNKYDLVHFDTLSLVPYLKYINNIPMVLDHHNIESHMLLRRSENESNLLKKWYYYQEGKRLQKFEKKFCPLFALNITCSKMDKDRLRTIAPASNIEEIPNGVDIEFVKPSGVVQQEKSLIFIGRLNWYPNVEAVRFIAHDLWPYLKDTMPEICFDIIGANPPEFLSELAEKDKNFRVHGFVDDMRPFLEKASIYICPIRDGGGTKLKILDAFAMGKAVVAHPIACEGINTIDGVNVVYANDIGTYVEKIIKLINNADYREQLGKAARQLVEQEYSFVNIGEKLSNLYRLMYK